MGATVGLLQCSRWLYVDKALRGEVIVTYVVGSINQLFTLRHGGTWWSHGYIVRSCIWLFVWRGCTSSDDWVVRCCGWFCVIFPVCLLSCPLLRFFDGIFWIPFSCHYRKCNTIITNYGYYRSHAIKCITYLKYTTEISSKMNNSNTIIMILNVIMTVDISEWTAIFWSS